MLTGPHWSVGSHSHLRGLSVFNVGLSRLTIISNLTIICNLQPDIPDHPRTHHQMSRLIDQLPAPTHVREKKVIVTARSR